jgi:hypothetical protein
MILLCRLPETEFRHGGMYPLNRPTRARGTRALGTFLRVAGTVPAKTDVDRPQNQDDIVGWISDVNVARPVSRDG